MNERAAHPDRAPTADVVHRLAAASNDEGDDASQAPGPSSSAGRDDLPYRVELWDQAKAAVEQVLAVTRNGSIGYAAYYEATRQFPNRYITLRHQGRILSRFNGPTH